MAVGKQHLKPQGCEWDGKKISPMGEMACAWEVRRKLGCVRDELLKFPDLTSPELARRFNEAGSGGGFRYDRALSPPPCSVRPEGAQGARTLTDCSTLTYPW